LDKLLPKYGEFILSLYYKIQYRPEDNFVWELVPGYPKPLNKYHSTDILLDIESISKSWDKIIHTFLYSMKTGIQRHQNGSKFSDAQIDHTEKSNPRPKFAIRINQRTGIECFEDMKDPIAYYAIKIRKLLKIVEILFAKTNIIKE
jgi:hypothetical protein